MSLFDDPFAMKKTKTKRRRILSGDRTTVLKRQKFKCAKCGKKLTDHPKNYHVDHKKPLSDGGGDTVRNMQALCLDCHNEKTEKEKTKRAKKRRKEKEKEENPFKDILNFDPFKPKRKGRKKKDPFSIF